MDRQTYGQTDHLKKDDLLVFYNAVLGEAWLLNKWPDR